MGESCPYLHTLLLKTDLYKPLITSQSSPFFNMENIIARLQALTIANFATPLPPATTVEIVEQAFDRLTLDYPSPPLPPSTTTSPDISATSSLPDGDLKRLCALDKKLDSHMKSILCCLDALSSPNLSSQDRVQVDLIEERRWLTSSIRELHGLEHHPDADIQVLAEAMRERLAQFTSAIDMYIEILRKRSPSQLSPHLVNTGIYLTHSSNLESNSTI
jgi:hypothetical protein